MQAVTIDALAIMYISLRKKIFELVSFRTEIAEHATANMMYMNSQENASSTISPSVGIGRIERVHIMKNVNAYIKNANNFRAVLFIQFPKRICSGFAGLKNALTAKHSIQTVLKEWAYA